MISQNITKLIIERRKKKKHATWPLNMFNFKIVCPFNNICYNGETVTISARITA